MSWFDKTRANDKDYMLKAVSHNGYALGYASDELKNEIYLKHRISRLILENDYYKYLWEVNSD